MTEDLEPGAEQWDLLGSGMPLCDRCSLVTSNAVGQLDHPFGRPR